MKHLNLLNFCAFLVTTALSIPSFAADAPYFHFTDYPKTSTDSSVPDNSSPPPKTGSSVVPMRVETGLRSADGIGSSISVYGGVTAFQNGTLEITSPAAPGAEIRASTKNSLGGVAGFKAGFTWPSFAAIGGDPESPSKPGLIEPALAGDFFWSGYKYKASGAGTTSSDGVTGNYDGTLTSNVNAYTFCVEPTVKFNLGAFRPYIGLGVGGTYIEADHAHVQGNAAIVGLGGINGGQDLTGSSNDFDFSAEGLAGAEYFFDKHWALSFDYKYLYIVSPTFHGDIPGSTVKYHLSGLGGNIFTSGISYYF